MKRMILILAVVVTGCEPTENGQTIPTTRVPVSYNGTSIYTTTHDGHRFVILAHGSDARVLLHHPDCCKPPPL